MGSQKCKTPVWSAAPGRWREDRGVTPGRGVRYFSCGGARLDASSDLRCREPASCAGRGGGAAPWEAARESGSRRWRWAARARAVAVRRPPRPRRGSPLPAGAGPPADGNRCRGRRRGRVLPAPGWGATRSERLRFVDLLVIGGAHLYRLRRRRRRMELGAEEHDEAAFFVHLVAHQALILRIVQQLAELLEAVVARLEVGTLLLDPIEEFVGGGAGIDVETMNLEDVAQQRDGLFGFGAGLFGSAAALHADHVAAFAAGDLDVIGLLQSLHEIGEGIGAVGLLIEGGIELQHGALEQTKLGADFAAFEDAEGALHQRHGLRQIERHALVRLALLLLGLLLLFGPVGMLLRQLLRRLVLRLRLLLRLFLWLVAGGPRAIVHYGFVGHEFVTILLQNCAGESAAADHEDALVILLELVDQGDEIAVARDDGIRVDVVVSEGHLECIECQVDVGAVLVAAR